jgi:hypothetical protein
VSIDYKDEYVRAALDLEEARRDQALADLRAEHTAGLAELRENWSSGVGTSVNEVQQRIETTRAEIRAFLHDYYADEPDEPSAPQTAQQEQSGTPTGAPAGLPPDLLWRQAEEDEAARIKGLSMASFAAERQALGVNRNQANGLFG